MKVLDHGFVRLVETWGSGDAGVPGAGIVEAARQSTQGTFRGWERDARLVRYMDEHRHGTPFEFAGLVLEVRAPIFVFRQWHRHRLFSINEMSARYGEVPALWYGPTVERVMAGAQLTDNRQASGTGAQLTERAAQLYLESLSAQCEEFQRGYEADLAAGVPKELARLGMPISYYSQMRVSCNLRGWLHFLSLRLDEHAQWEIRQYAAAVADLIAESMPEVWAVSGVPHDL